MAVPRRSPAFCARSLAHPPFLPRLRLMTPSPWAERRSTNHDHHRETPHPHRLHAPDTTGVVNATAAIGDHLDRVPQLATRFHVKHRRIIGWITRWCTYWLIGATRRKTGSIGYAAGSRIGRLDLSAAATAAYLNAVARWTYWQQITNGTRAASPWDDFKTPPPRQPQSTTSLRRPSPLHQPGPHPCHGDRQRETHHAPPPRPLRGRRLPGRLPRLRHQLAALASDAMLTATGEFLQPESASFIDVLTYLRQVAEHIHQLGRRHQLVAMTI